MRKSEEFIANILEQEKGKIGKLSNYDLWFYGPVSRHTLIKTMMFISDKSKKIKLDYDISDSLPEQTHGLPNMSIGIDVVKRQSSEKENIYFFINHYITNSVYSDDQKYYKYIIYSVNKQFNDFPVELGSIAYIIDENKKDIYIAMVHTDRKYRNMGVGKQLHRVVEEIAGRLGMRAIVLDSVDTAYSFHKKNGFVKRYNTNDGFTKPFLSNTIPMIKKKIREIKCTIKCPFEILHTSPNRILENKEKGE